MQQEIPATGIKVMVVDDEESNRIIISTWLQRLGYTCFRASDGLDALLQLDREPCEIVVMDWHMPGMDGLELIRLLRARAFKQVPYLVLTTGDPDPKALKEAFDSGADDFIRKPVDASELMSRLRGANRIMELEKRVYAQAQGEALNGLHRGAIRELSEVVATLAHDLRTPLATLRILAEGLHNKIVDKDSPLFPMAKRLCRVSAGMADTLDDVVSAFVVDDSREPQWTEFDSREEINKCLEMIASTLPNPGMVSVPENSVDILGNPHGFRRVLMNLISNSLRHGRAESIKITLDLHAADHDFVVLEVVDDGQGIAPDLLKHLGEPLFLSNATHRQQFFVNGTGLGLFICRRILSAFDGRLIVASGQGKGTHVKVFLRRNLSAALAIPDLSPIDFEVIR